VPTGIDPLGRRAIGKADHLTTFVLAQEISRRVLPLVALRERDGLARPGNR
jgi:hypothetical protein